MHKLSQDKNKKTIDHKIVRRLGSLNFLTGDVAEKLIDSA